eukprot:677857-Prymnesium_polylepis.1
MRASNTFEKCTPPSRKGLARTRNARPHGEGRGDDRQLFVGDEIKLKPRLINDNVPAARQRAH